MEDLSLLLIGSSLAVFVAAALARRRDPRLFSLSFSVSALAALAVASDASVELGSPASLVALAAPLSVAIYSVPAMLFGRD